MRWRGARSGDRGSRRGVEVVAAIGQSAATPATCRPHSERNAAQRRSPPSGGRSPWSAPTCSTRVLGAWLATRAVQGSGGLVIAIDGKTVRGAKGRGGRAPHLRRGPGARHRRVPRPGRRRREVQRDPRRSGAAEGVRRHSQAVFTIDTMHAQTDTAKMILARRADYVITVKADMPFLSSPLKKLPWAAIPAVSSMGQDHGRQARRPSRRRSRRPGSVRQRRPGRAAAPHRHAEREEDRRDRLPGGQRQDVDPATLATWVRSHWKIQKYLHWVRDVTTWKTNRWSGRETRPR